MTTAVLADPETANQRMKIQNKIARIKDELGHLTSRSQRMQEGQRRKTRELRRLEAELAACGPAPVLAVDV